jgi:hypothetical protein
VIHGRYPLGITRMQLRKRRQSVEKPKTHLPAQKVTVKNVLSKHKFFYKVFKRGRYVKIIL